MRVGGTSGPQQVEPVNEVLATPIGLHDLHGKQASGRRGREGGEERREECGEERGGRSVERRGREGKRGVRSVERREECGEERGEGVWRGGRSVERREERECGEEGGVCSMLHSTSRLVNGGAEHSIHGTEEEEGSKSKEE